MVCLEVSEFLSRDFLVWRPPAMWWDIDLFFRPRCIRLMQRRCCVCTSVVVPSFTLKFLTSLKKAVLILHIAWQIICFGALSTHFWSSAYFLKRSSIFGHEPWENGKNFESCYSNWVWSMAVTMTKFFSTPQVIWIKIYSLSCEEHLVHWWFMKQIRHLLLHWLTHVIVKKRPQNWIRFTSRWIELCPG